ncbi:unnamed protein product [Prorocentrum cordatum]|uniref:EF-hand domain-containing protein n=2 Tax=Prorocentrum cordatum TaxID=2364126 RepID=A0ABN9XBY8_9DINO|nr:unnamed protein product [Polarella glacialis]
MDESSGIGGFAIGGIRGLPFEIETLFQRSDEEEVDLKNDDNFDGLMMRTRQAHQLEIRCLQCEVQSLRKRLAAASRDRNARVDALAKRADLPVDPELVYMVIEEPFPGQKEASTDAPSHVADRASAGLSESPSGRPGPQRGHEGGGKPAQQEGAMRGGQTRRASAPLSANVKRQVTWADSLVHSVKYQRHVVESLRTRSALTRLIQHPGFEVLVASVIVLNGAVMAAEAQYQGFNLAVWTGHDAAGRASSEVWPHGAAVFLACEWIFGVFFLVEIIIRIAAERLQFLRDYWNCLDLLVVALWTASRFEIGPSVNVQMLRLARLSRLGRLVRLVRYLNSSRFDSLYVMVTSLQGAVAVLAWSFTLLLILHMILALAVNQALHIWYFDEGKAEEQAEVFEYFGSFTRSLLTMFEFTLANWIVPARVLMDQVHESLFIYSILHKMVLGFAIIGVVNGIFIQETFKVAAMDDAIMVRQTTRKQTAHIAKMKSLFATADTNRDCAIDRDEWLELCEDDWVNVWLKAQDFPDPLRLFDELTHGRERLTAQELIEGTARMKSDASPLGVVRLISEARDRVISEVRECLKGVECTLHEALALKPHTVPNHTTSP